MAAAPTDIWAKTSASFVTLRATAPPAIALPVTARHATATQATRGGAASAATPACPRWTATGSLEAPCSPPRMKMKMRRVPLSPYLTQARALRARKQGERGGWADGRRPGEQSKESQPWPGPATAIALVRVDIVLPLNFYSL